MAKRSIFWTGSKFEGVDADELNGYDSTRFSSKQELTDHNANPDAHQDIRNIIKNIDVKTDVEEVINERINSDSTKTLNTIVTEHKDTIVNAIGGLPQKAQWTDARATSIDTILANTNTNNTANNTGTLSQKLSYISNNLIGATGNTGGSETAGTVMGKLNNITNSLVTIKNEIIAAGGGGDFVGKDILFESATVKNTPFNKQYTNAKGGMIVIRFSYDVVAPLVRLTVDGVVKYDGIVTNLVVSSTQHDYSTTSHPIYVPFSNSFELYVSQTSNIRNVYITYYINK